MPLYTAFGSGRTTLKYLALVLAGFYKNVVVYFQTGSKKYLQTNQYKKCRSQWRLEYTDGADTHPAVSLCAYL